MVPWDFTGLDFDDIAGMPTWALLQLPLDENREFILQTPEEDEEVGLPDEINDADDEETYPDLNHLSRRIREIREEGPSFMQSFEPLTSAELQERICEMHEREEERRIWEHSHARDSERPNFLSKYSDYSQESSLRLDEPPPRIDFSGGFGRIIRNDISSPTPGHDDQTSDNSPEVHPESDKTSSISESILVMPTAGKINKGIPRVAAAARRSPRTRLRVPSPAIHHDPLVIADNPNGDATSMLAGFETMNVGELILDYANTPKYHPVKPSVSDSEGPKHFDLEPHWFHDTSKTKCWCYHCIEYRKIQSTGKQPETHDFNKWCLCTVCMEYWHGVLAVGYMCNCPDCKKRCEAQAILKESDEAQAISEEKEALSTLQTQFQPPPTSQEPQEPQQTVDASTQQSPPNPLCPDATAAASESQKLNFELFDVIRENLTFDSDSDA